MKRGILNWFKSALFCGVAAAGATNVAHAWWSDEWAVRKPITVDMSADGASISENIADGAPVLVRLHIGNFQFDQIRADGGDIRFVSADDKTVLPHHVAQIDSLLGEAFVWVRVPDIKGGEKNNIWLYYGNQMAVPADDVRKTYDTDTVLVWHFGERGQPARDFSGNDNNAQNAAIPVEGSLIGTGARFQGVAGVTVPASASLQWQQNQPLTWSAWVRPGSLSGNNVLFSRRDGGSAFLVGLDNGVPYAEVVNAGRTERTPAGAPLAQNTWQHLAVKSAGGALTLYVDGKPYTNLSVAVPAMNSAITIGADTDAAAPGSYRSGFVGEMVEMQLARAARTDAFIRFMAATQGGEAAMRAVALGADEGGNASSGSHSGYFTVILQSLTFDGWVVVVLCAFMAVLSWIVMFGKNAYINTARKSNELFMQVFSQHVASDLTILDSGDTHKISSMGGKLTDEERRLISKSPIYRLYHVGAEEIRKRLEAARGGKTDKSRTNLSPDAIKSIGASLDGAQVRELQRLNKQIVLLTIAISGGPFLGLLGTVVGVMITFAAVAMAGDVNVNAIAPGIAAALLATVAGLAVAIPALFGYNYLLTRIKDISADMQVFADEFLTKVAEFYPSKKD